MLTHIHKVRRGWVLLVFLSSIVFCVFSANVPLVYGQSPGEGGLYTDYTRCPEGEVLVLGVTCKPADSEEAKDWLASQSSEQVSGVAPDIPNPPFVPLSSLPGFSSEPTHTPDVAKYLNVLFILSISIGAMLAVIMIAIGGFQYMGSEVITEKSAGKKRIEGAILGLVIVLSTTLVLETIYSDFSNLNIFQNFERVVPERAPLVVADSTLEVEDPCMIIAEERGTDRSVCAELMDEGRIAQARLLATQYSEAPEENRWSAEYVDFADRCQKEGGKPSPPMIREEDGVVVVRCYGVSSLEPGTVNINLNSNQPTSFEEAEMRRLEQERALGETGGAGDGDDKPDSGLSLGVIGGMIGVAVGVPGLGMIGSAADRNDDNPNTNSLADSLGLGNVGETVSNGLSSIGDAVGGLFGGPSDSDSDSDSSSDGGGTGGAGGGSAGGAGDGDGGKNK